jgi:hypothetical protein
MLGYWSDKVERRCCKLTVLNFRMHLRIDT